MSRYRERETTRYADNGIGDRANNFDSNRKKYIYKEGDWRCPDENCANQNFARREKCNRCGMSRPIRSRSRSDSRMKMRKYSRSRSNDRNDRNNRDRKYSKSRSRSVNKSRQYDDKDSDLFKFKEGDWKCDRCNNINFAWRNECNRCKEPKDRHSENVSKSNMRRDDRRNDRNYGRRDDRRDDRNYIRRDDRNFNRDNDRNNDTKFSSTNPPKFRRTNRSRSNSNSSLFSSQSSLSRRRHHNRRTYRSRSKSSRSLSPVTNPLLTNNETAFNKTFKDKSMTLNHSDSINDSIHKMRFKTDN